MQISTDVLLRCCAGLVWIRLPDNGNSAQQRLSLIFFCLMMFTMTPFGYMAFPIADKRFFLLDSAKGLYAPSAYFMAYVTSSEHTLEPT